MNEPKHVFTTLYTLERRRRSLPDMTVPEAIAWLQGLLKQIPKEWRDYSTFEVELESDWDSTELNVQVYYSRPETEEEAAIREAKDANNKEQSRLSEIARLRSNLARLEAR